MNEPEKLTITIGNSNEIVFDENTLVLPTFPFKIEPPINVVSPGFLQAGINEVAPPSRSVYEEPLASNTEITHSIPKVATYGSLSVARSVAYAGLERYPLNGVAIEPAEKARHREVRDEFQALVSKGFSAAINPYGDVELEFVFIQPTEKSS